MALRFPRYDALKMRDAMLGPGGEIRTPQSESSVLTSVYNLLAEVIHSSDHRTAIRRAQEALSLVQDLRDQVSAGYHRNPGVYGPFKLVGVIGKDVHSVAYQHAKDGKLYKHDFKRGSAQAIAVERHGKRDILITGDVPLWDEF